MSPEPSLPGGTNRSLSFLDGVKSAGGSRTGLLTEERTDRRRAAADDAVLPLALGVSPGGVAAVEHGGRGGAGTDLRHSTAQGHVQAKTVGHGRHTADDRLQTGRA